VNIVRNQEGQVVGVGGWATGFVPIQRREMTLDEEVQKNGLNPVVRRMKRQGNWEIAAELLRKYRYN
jgi:hypothetical protein